MSTAQAPKMDAQAQNLPHMISVMNAVDFQTQAMPCDLANLTVGQVYAFCSQQFGTMPDSFDLLHANNVLVNDANVKAIDIGLSNGMYLVMQPRGAYNPGFDMVVAAAQSNLPSPHTMLPSPPMMPSPQMLPSPQMMPSPTLQPLSPMIDPAAASLDMQQYDIALAQNVASQMHLSAALGLPMPNVSPTHSPTGVAAQQPLPMPVSPPMFGMQQPMLKPEISRVARPTGNLNLTSMGDLCSYAMTNEGSRALVVAIEEAENVEAISAKIQELGPKFGVVASHQHGSKMVRALIKVANKEQITAMLVMACGAMLELCDSNTGSDVFVEVIHATTEADAALVVKEIVSIGVRVCTIINGRKIIQAVLTKYPAETVEPIFDMIGQNLLHLATDQTGCVTIQRCLDHAGNLKLKMQLQLQIMEATKYLISDMYGNYVLQHAIKNDPCYSQILANKFQGKVCELATNKYASCVIEKCLAIAADEVREQIILEVLKDVKKMMWDGYGNFVVQSAVDYAPASMVDVLKDAITPFINDCPYGYRIEGKLNKRMKKGGRKHSQATRPAARDRSLSPEEQLVQMWTNSQQPQNIAASPQQQLALQMSRLALAAGAAPVPQVPIVPAP